PHAEDVEGLALDVLRPHVDVALEAQEGGDGRGGDAVLAGAGLGDEAALAHALGQEALAEDVVDLVGAGVAEVLALEVDPGAPAVLPEPRRLPERRRAARVVGEEPGEPRLEAPVPPGGRPGPLQLDERAHERLRHEAAAVAAEVPAAIGQPRADACRRRPPGPDAPAGRGLAGQGPRDGRARLALAPPLRAVEEEGPTR